MTKNAASPPQLETRWPRPARPRPIVIIGSGGIVRDAHLPAYRRAKFPVLGIYDLDRAQSAKTARDWNIKNIFSTLEEAAAAQDVVFDVAVPAPAILSILRMLPRGAGVLIQKPLGRDLAEARAILALARRRNLKAAVNFQLRYSPNMLALRDAIGRGILGEITDIEFRVNTHTPWKLWSFLKGIPRLEILYHSIHYLDWIRSIAGEPTGVDSRAMTHPDSPGYADVRSSTLVHYKNIRCAIYTNHNHPADSPDSASNIKIEGTRGAAIARLGVNLDYPKGKPDTLQISRDGGPFRSVALPGSWFSHAFEGPMSNLQRYISGEDEILQTRVADAARTMALVDACYQSAHSRGTRVPRIAEP